jgi:ACS family hexuronate transporter-like MFS transporter
VPLPTQSPMSVVQREATAPSDRLASRFRWVIIGILFFATTINYVDRQILALLKPTLDKELLWSNEDYGNVNSAFYGVYAASYAVFGWFIDRYGVKLGYLVSIVWWSIAALSHSLAHSAQGFMNARIALGSGEGGNFPACIKSVAVWFPRRERAFAASLFNSGASIGPIIAPAVVPWIAFTYGWRMAFVAAGIAGFLWVLLWLPLYQDSPARSRLVSPAELALIEGDREEQGSAGGRVVWWKLFALRQTWAIVLLKFLTDPVSWFFLTWLPDFFNQTRGLDIKNSWKHLITIYLIALVLSISGGWVTGHLMGRGWTATRARKTGMFLFACCVLPVMFVDRCGNWTAVALIGLALASHHAWTANVYAMTSDIFPKRAVAAIAGIAGMAGAVGGMIFPKFAGRLLDHYKHSPGGVTAGYAILFTICGSAYLIALLVNHLLAPRFEQVELKAA